MSTLIVTADISLADPVRRTYLETNSPLSSEQHQIIEGYESALLTLERVNDFKNIILVTNDAEPQVQDFVTYVQRKAKGPLIIATDNPDVRLFFRSKNVHFFAPLSKIDSTILQSMCDASQSLYNTSQSIQHLEDIYHQAEQRFRDVADHFSDWLWEVDEKLMITFSSTSKRALEKASVGIPFPDCFLDEEGGRIQDFFSELFYEPKPFRDVEYWGLDPYGSRVCIALNGVPILNKLGKCIGYRGIGRDISAEKTSADQLYFLSNNDALTGLYNRNRMKDELSRTLKRHQREGGEGALILVNIDRFKYINDSFGYEIGDKVIMHIAQALRSSIRQGDFLARLGGDEFGVVLTHVNLADAEKRLQNFLRIMQSSPFYYDGREIRVTGSAGLVMFPNAVSSIDELFTRANIALSQAKIQGQNSYISFNEDHLNSYDVSRRLEMVNFVHQCLEREQERLVLYYQPIVSLNGATATERYEVLVRLIDDNGEVMAPLRFIEVAEDHGLISKLDQIIAKRAINTLEAHQKQGKKITFSINISGRTFEDADAIETILNHIEQADILPGTIVFEITETAALVDLHKARRIISSFKKLGVSFALDDCGVGYSSLNYIRQLDLDFIKIDGSFIRDLHRNKDDDAFVRAIRDVAHRMKIKTVAEMVEDEEVVSYLKQLGIDYAQGYHFAVPAETLPESFDDIQNKIAPSETKIN